MWIAEPWALRVPATFILQLVYITTFTYLYKSKHLTFCVSFIYPCLTVFFQTLKWSPTAVTAACGLWTSYSSKGRPYVKPATLTWVDQVWCVVVYICGCSVLNVSPLLCHVSRHFCSCQSLLMMQGKLGNISVMTNSCYSNLYTDYSKELWLDGFLQTQTVPLLSPKYLWQFISFSPSLCLCVRLSFWCVSGYRKHSGKVSTITFPCI